MPDAELLLELGELKGRVGSLESRVDRHENFVAAALRDMNTSVTGLGTKMEAGYNQLVDQMGALRLTMVKDTATRDAETAEDDKNQAATQAAQDRQTNIRIAKWSITMTVIATIVGALIECDTHIVVHLFH